MARKASNEQVMRIPLRTGLAALLVLACVTPPARAGDTGAGCGSSSYSSNATCSLVFRGSPLTVFADATAGGTATVTVRLTIEELGDASPVILECTARASSYASCSKGLPDDTTRADHGLLQQFHLRCTVSSNGTGQYRCVSGLGV